MGRGAGSSASFPGTNPARESVDEVAPLSRGGEGMKDPISSLFDRPGGLLGVAPLARGALLPAGG